MEIGMFISNNWHSRTLSNPPGGKVISNTKTSLTDYLLTEFFCGIFCANKIAFDKPSGGSISRKAK